MAVNEVSITIRGFDGTKDYSLSCCVGWSVSKLKEVIRDVHPSKPETCHQKLYYQEIELTDNQAISSFLQTTDEFHVIGLVLKHKEATTNNQSSPCSSQSTYGNLRYRHSAAATPLPPNHPWMQWQQNHMAAYQHYPYPQTLPAHDNYDAMLKQYQQQVNDYMRYYNAYAQNQVPAQMQSPPTPAVQAGGANPAAAPPEPPPPQANQPDANPPMNAQGGFVMADNDDLAANDWLDIIFALMRYAFLLSIIVFYSNFWRFLLVAGFFFLLYIYQSGLFRAQRRAPPPEEVERNREAEPDNADDNNNDDNSNNDAGDTDEPVEPPHSLFATAWCFITTFFSSLIPQPPPVV